MSEMQDVKSLIEIFDVEKRIEGLKEIEIPARILDLITSFVDSSTKPGYYFNRPPYAKILKDGSYWQFEFNKCELSTNPKCPCVKFVSWKHKLVIYDDLKLIAKINGYKLFDLSELSEIINIVFYSSYRKTKIKLFDVYRKLRFYEHIANIDQQQQS